MEEVQEHPVAAAEGSAEHPVAQAKPEVISSFPGGTQNVKAQLMPLIEQAIEDTPEIFERSSHEACLRRALVLLPAMTQFIGMVHLHQQVLSKAVLNGGKDLEANTPNYVISCASQDSKAECSIARRWCQNLIIIKFLGGSLARSVLGGAAWRWGWNFIIIEFLSGWLAWCLASRLAGREFCLHGRSPLSPLPSLLPPSLPPSPLNRLNVCL